MHSLIAMSLLHTTSLTLLDAFPFQWYIISITCLTAISLTLLGYLPWSMSLTQGSFALTFSLCRKREPQLRIAFPASRECSHGKNDRREKNRECYLLYLDCLRKCKYHCFKSCPCCMKYEVFPLDKLHIQKEAIML